MTRELKPRPTIYKGIHMRSRLEASFAQWLDSWPFLHWEYEPCAFASEGGQYLPDFRAEGFRATWLDGYQRVYFEVKPSIFGWQPEWDALTCTTPEMERAAEQESQLERKMLLIAQSDPTALLVIARQRKEGFADFMQVVSFEEDGEPYTEPLELIAGDQDGYIPAFAQAGAPAVPPWLPGYWKR